MQHDIRIEPAHLELLPRLAELRAQMEREVVRRDLDDDVEGWRERFIEFFGARQRGGTSQPFVAMRGDMVIGVALASLVDDYRNAVLLQRRGYINVVYVIPAQRGAGIGRALTEAAIAWLREQGCTAVRLNPSAQAEPLYRSMGFVPSGELKLDF